MTAAEPVYYLLTVRKGRLHVGGVYTNAGTAALWANRTSGVVVTPETADDEQRAVVAEYEERIARQAEEDAKYAAAGWRVDGDPRHHLEMQVRPGSVSLYISGPRAYRAREARWHGEYATSIGHAVCRGEMPPAVFADWCEEYPAEQGGRDAEFSPVAWMRRAVAF